MRRGSAASRRIRLPLKSTDWSSAGPPKVSVGTVYRNFRLFVDAGLLGELPWALARFAVSGSRDG